MDSVAQPAIASSTWAISSGVTGCLLTKERQVSGLREKNSGALTRHWSQSMHVLST